LQGTTDFRLLADSDVAQETDSNFAIVPFVIRSELVAALRAAVRCSSTTLFTIVMAAIVATMAHSSGRSEVTVLTVQAGREQLCLYHMVGAAAYIAALKMIVEEQTSLQKLATQVQAALDVTMEYQVPFECVRLRLRELGTSEFEVPLVNLSDLEQMPHTESLGSPVRANISVAEAPRPELVSPRMPQFTICIRSLGGALNGELLYRTSLYGGSAADAFVSSLCRLLGSADLQRPITDLLV
jgi:non-ribosomal peptide synthetase component F